MLNMITLAAGAALDDCNGDEAAFGVVFVFFSLVAYIDNVICFRC